MRFVVDIKEGNGVTALADGDVESNDIQDISDTQEKNVKYFVIKHQ